MLLRPALNIFGDPIERPVSERFFAKPKPDPEFDFLLNHNIGVRAPDRDNLTDPRTGLKRPITEGEYYKLVSYFGPAFRDNLRYVIPSIRTLQRDEIEKEVRRQHAAALKRARTQLMWDIYSGEQD